VQHAVAVVLAAVAAALLAVTAAVIHGLVSEYGTDVFPDGSWAVLVLVPAALALLCLVGARDPVGRPRPRTSVLAVGVLGVFVATGAAAVAHGGSVHERDRKAEAAACSGGDLALFAAVDAPGVHSEPAGDADGGCSMVVSWVPDPTRAQAAVAAALERGGWQRIARDGDQQVFRRQDEVLRLFAVSDGTATDVRLTLQ
jgi:hypothetical protein